MRHLIASSSFVLLAVACASTPAFGQAQTQSQATPPVAHAAIVNCESDAAARKSCAADTSQGVVLLRATGKAACILGKNWGYDDKSIWVQDGCSGEFVVGKESAQPATAGTGQVGASSAGTPPPERVETWGEFDPGKGFLVGRSGVGQLEISAYALIRYINQMPGSQTFTDHLGVEHTVDGRNDLYPHRIMVFLKGWIGDPKFVYNIFFWTVNPTDQKNIFASIGYQFSRRFSLYAGLNGLPGTRSLQGSHPYWLGHDRAMADEFFRPYFSNGVWAQGELLPGFWYNVMAANNMSALGVKGNAAGSDVELGRVRLVDADDERIRAARRLRRLGVPRKILHTFRYVHDLQSRRNVSPIPPPRRPATR